MICKIYGDTATKVSIKFKKAPFLEGSQDDLTYQSKWGLSFFKKIPLILNTDLAITSCALSTSAYDEQIARENVIHLGFENVKSYNYSKDCNEFCGCVIASQKLDTDETLVCTVIRGTCTGQWQSNFELGHDEHHQSFQECSSNIYHYIKLYLQENNIDNENFKLYICGHSKGGAVANLLAARFVDEIPINRVYCYTFAAPNVTKNCDTDFTQYKGIFNYVKADDFITMCPLSRWGFHRYGTDINILRVKNDSSEIFQKTKAAFTQITKGGELTFFENGDITAKDFIKRTYDLAANADEYYNRIIDKNDLHISLYKYFCKVASIIDNSNTSDAFEVDSMLFFMATLSTPLDVLSNFFMQGFANPQKSPVTLSHLCEAYLSVLTAMYQ